MYHLSHIVYLLTGDIDHRVDRRGKRTVQFLCLSKAQHTMHRVGSETMTSALFFCRFHFGY